MKALSIHCRCCCPRTSLSCSQTDRNNWVCAIEDGTGKIGTGILVGADLVLTNYHVLKTLIRQAGKLPCLARCRFNYKQNLLFGELSEERSVKLAANWSQDLPKSRYSDKDTTGDETGFEPDCLDYAIIRLAEKVGDQGVEDPADPEAPQRSWLTIPGRARPAGRERADLDTAASGRPRQQDARCP